ncbi:MAG: FAD-dependent oxidoreductase [Candidatus Cyclobacteriaceae bacterium M3_2C_046]
MRKKMIKCIKGLGLVLAFGIISLPLTAQKHFLVEAESFREKGGWVVDQQFIDIIGSSYLLAHGMGQPVANAQTTIEVSKPGNYYVWVRTKDWAPFPQGPGKFKLKINDQPLEVTFGSNGSDAWRWYKGGQVNIKNHKVRLALVDLTGFEGRCDAILLTVSENFVPPNLKEELDQFRAEMLQLSDQPIAAGHYDIVVIGGGMAGICTAIQSARLGLEVALIQNRPVLGGNNSSEIRVHLMGNIDKNHYPKLGRIVRELDNGDPGNAHRDPKAYGDYRKLYTVQAEENIDLHLNTHAFALEMDGENKIKAVIAKHIETNQELKFSGELFVDCTGDGTIGYLAGADYRVGRESRLQTGESMAPIEADTMTMGFSNLWNAVEGEQPSDFPETPWALPFSDEYHWEITRADWRWETGFGNFDPIWDAEQIRDHNFRAIYGNWSYLKNQKKEKYANHHLNWVAYVSGKRESRRLMGDLVLQEQDLKQHKIYPDGFVTATWSIDLHYPDSVNSLYYPGQEFISWYVHPDIKPYPIPYRCLYSRNINNLMMAGRDISVTHVALGAVRVMRTTGMMGELLGYASYLARKYDTTPRGVYENHLEELKYMLTHEIIELVDLQDRKLYQER